MFMPGFDDAKGYRRRSGIRDYRVAWEIDIAARSPRHAAEIARSIQSDPDSLATVYGVTGPASRRAVTVDLEPPYRVTGNLMRVRRGLR